MARANRKPMSPNKSLTSACPGSKHRLESTLAMHSSSSMHCAFTPRLSLHYIHLGCRLQARLQPPIRHQISIRNEMRMSVASPLDTRKVKQFAWTSAPPPIQHPPPIRRAIARMRRKARKSYSLVKALADVCCQERYTPASDPAPASD